MDSSKFVSNGDSRQISQSTSKLRQRLSKIGWILAIIFFCIILSLIGIILWQKLGIGSKKIDLSPFLPPKKTWIDEEGMRRMIIERLNFAADPCDNFVSYACKAEDEPHRFGEIPMRRRSLDDDFDEPYWIRTAKLIIAQCNELRNKSSTNQDQGYNTITDVDLVLTDLRRHLREYIEDENLPKLAAILRRDYGLHFPFKFTGLKLAPPDSIIPWPIWENFDDLSPHGQTEILKIRSYATNNSDILFEHALASFINDKSDYVMIDIQNNTFWNWTEYFTILGLSADLDDTLLFSTIDFYGLIAYLNLNLDSLRYYLLEAVWVKIPNYCQDLFPMLSEQKNAEQKTEIFKTKLDFLQNLASLLKHAYIEFAGNLLGQQHAKKMETILQNVNIQIGTPDYTKQLDALFKENLVTGKNFLESYYGYNAFLSKVLLSATAWELWDRFSSMVGSPMFDPRDNTVYFSDAWLIKEHVNLDLPYAVIAGQFLSALGHELTHALYHVRNDPQFPELSTVGIDKTIYTHATKCIQESYTMQAIENETLVLSGSKTFEENLADLLGLLLSVNVYEKHLKPLDYLPPAFPLTQEQLFFAAFGTDSSICDGFAGYRRLYVQLADGEHPVGWIRLETLLKNVPQFSNAFNCTNGATMNSDQKCAALFGYFENVSN